MPPEPTPSIPRRPGQAVPAVPTPEAAAAADADAGPARTDVERDTRTRLLASATALFAERGFLATSVREVCAAAGVNVAAVHYHFGSKDALYAEVITAAYEATSEDRPMPRLDEAPDARAALRAWVTWYARRVLGPRGDLVQRLFAHEILHPTPALDAVVQRAIGPLYRHLAEIVRAVLVEDGVADAEERTVVAHCASIIGQCIVHRMAAPIFERLEFDRALHADGDEAPYELVGRHVADAALAALDADARRQRADQEETR